jgi:hypothetical protein
MPERQGARGRRNGGNRRGTLTDSYARMPAPRPVSDSDPRKRSRNGEQEEFVLSNRLTLPSMPIATPHQAWEEEALPGDYEPLGYDTNQDSDYSAYDDAEYDRGIDGPMTYSSRRRERSLARPLVPALPEYNYDDVPGPRLNLYPPLPQESAPDLVAYRPPRPRVRRATERLIKSARNPWIMARLILALTAAVLGYLHAPGRMGEPSQPLQVARAQMALSPGMPITSLVKPETQLKRPDLYDSYAQFQEWGGAACSAAAISEILTAYGVRGATIGHEIDELGKYIDPNWGLLNRHAFAIVAAKHGLRADESNSWTYNQIIYVTQHLGIPVIVNVRISYGYYSFFSGGHFLVVVGGDSQGLAIVDSSEYYIHYLPKDVFYQMFTGYTAAIAPADDHYNLPAK